MASGPWFLGDSPLYLTQPKLRLCFQKNVCRPLNSSSKIAKFTLLTGSHLPELPRGAFPFFPQRRSILPTYPSGHSILTRVPSPAIGQ